MTKIFTKETIKELPIEIQEQVLATLRVYDYTHIRKINGRWNVSPHSSITSFDREIEDYGDAYQADFYNEEERRQIINELNCCQWY